MSKQKVIGAKIVLDGEGDFKRAVSACNSALKAMQSEVKLTDETYKQNAKSMDALIEKNKSLKDEWQAADRLVTTLKEAVKSSTNDFNNIAKSLDAYRNKLSDANKELDELEKSQASTDEIDNQKVHIAELESVVNKLQKGYLDAEKNMYDWKKQQADAETTMKSLENQIEKNNKEQIDLNKSMKDSEGSTKSIINGVKKIGDASTALGTFTSVLQTGFGLKLGADIEQAFIQLAKTVYATTKEIVEAYDTLVMRTGKVGEAGKQMNKTFNSAYGDSVAGAQDVSKSLADVTQRFNVEGKAAEEAAKMSLRFAKVNEIDVDTAVRGAARVLSGFNEDFSKYGQLMDEITTAHQMSGVDVSSLFGSLTRYGPQLREINFTMEDSIALLTAFEEKGVEASAAMPGLKYAATYWIKAGKDPAQEFLRLLEDVENAEDDITKQRIIQTELGRRSWNAMGDAIINGKLNIEEYKAALENASGSTQSSYEATVHFWSQVEKGIHNVKIVASDFANVLIEDATPAAKEAVGLLQQMREAVDDMDENTKRSMLYDALVPGGLETIDSVIQGVHIIKDTMAGIYGVMQSIKAEIPNMEVLSGPIGDFVSMVAKSELATTGSIGAYMAMRSTVKDMAHQFGEMTGAFVEATEEEKSLIKTTEELHDKNEGLIDSVKDFNESYDKTMSSYETNARSADNVIKSLVDLQGQFEENAGVSILMETELDKLNAIYPDLNLSIDKTTGDFIAQGEVVLDLTKYMQEYQNQLKQQSRLDYMKKAYSELNDVEAQIYANNKAIEKTKKVMENHKSWYGGDKEYYEAKRQQDELIADNKKLREQQDELNYKISYMGESYGKAQLQIQKTTDNTVESSNRIVENTKQQYTRLAEHIADNTHILDDGTKIIDVDAVKESFGEIDNGIEELFKSTVEKFNTAQEGMTTTLTNDVVSMTSSIAEELKQSKQEWIDYKKSIEDAVKEPSKLFNEEEWDDSIFWDKMASNMDLNAVRYEQFNRNVKAILDSTRYYSDETFRELANRIMKGGIDNEEYLNQFVNNVDMSVREASDDLSEFMRFSGASDTYSEFMTEINAATKDGCDGIVKQWDDTKTTVEKTMDDLKSKLDEQAKVYENYSSNVENIVNSDLYNSDDRFKKLANILISQGISGADSIDAIWKSLQGDNQSMDEVLGSFESYLGKLQEYTDIQSSTDVALQNGIDAKISILHSGEEALLSQMENDLTLNGVDLEPLKEQVKGTLANAGKDGSNELSQQMTSEEAVENYYRTGDMVGKEMGKGYISGYVAYTKEWFSHPENIMDAFNFDDPAWSTAWSRNTKAFIENFMNLPGVMSPVETTSKDEDKSKGGNSVVINVNADGMNINEFERQLKETLIPWIKYGSG